MSHLGVINCHVLKLIMVYRFTIVSSCNDIYSKVANIMKKSFHVQAEKCDLEVI